jgi:hypothetical protein
LWLLQGPRRKDREPPMKLYMFTSSVKGELHAFGADAWGSKLPEKYGPWTPTGTIEANRSPPHGFSRRDIERAIETQGFQLWRNKPPGKT